MSELAELIDEWEDAEGAYWCLLWSKDRGHEIRGVAADDLDDQAIVDLLGWRIQDLKNGED